MKTLCLCLILIAANISACSIAASEPTRRPYLDIPIHQSVNRGGALRYAVWVKVGERTVEALLDTGSTGLRVLASVMPNPPASTMWIDEEFGGSLRMKGWVVRAPIEIGSMTGQALVQVIDDVACSSDQPVCGAFPINEDSFRIGGDAFPHQGYSAILGVGLPLGKDTLGNPLQAVGAKRWIVDLPRPNELVAGHLILDPSGTDAEGFTTLRRTGKADADGCLEGSFVAKKQCGTVLFDTGAPILSLTSDIVEAPSALNSQEAGSLTLPLSSGEEVRIDFHAGESGGLREVRLEKPEPYRHPDPFILAGISPFFSYDMLYDPAAHIVAVRRRPPLLPPSEGDIADLDEPFSSTAHASSTAHRSPLLTKKDRRATALASPGSERPF